MSDDNSKPTPTFQSFSNLMMGDARTMMAAAGHPISGSGSSHQSPESFMLSSDDSEGAFGDDGAEASVEGARRRPVCTPSAHALRVEGPDALKLSTCPTCEKPAAVKDRQGGLPGAWVCQSCLSRGVKILKTEDDTATEALEAYDPGEVAKAARRAAVKASLGLHGGAPTPRQTEVSPLLHAAQMWPLDRPELDQLGAALGVNQKTLDTFPVGKMLAWNAGAQAQEWVICVPLREAPTFKKNLMPRVKPTTAPLKRPKHPDEPESNSFGSEAEDALAYAQKAELAATVFEVPEDDGLSDDDRLAAFRAQFKDGENFSNILLLSPVDGAPLPRDHLGDAPRGSKRSPIGLDKINPDHLVVTYGFREAILLHASGFPNVIALPDEAWGHAPDVDFLLGSRGLSNPLDPVERMLGPLDDGKVSRFVTEHLSFLQEHEASLSICRKLTILMPPTRQNQPLGSELMRRLGRERCFEAKMGDVLDLHDFWEGGASNIQTLVTGSKPFPIRGLIEISDVDLESLYHSGRRQGFGTGWGLDQIYTPIPGQFTMVTGAPSSGKSQVLLGMLVNMAAMHGMKFGVFSPENQPENRFYSSLVETVLKKPFSISPRDAEAARYRGIRRLTLPEMNAVQPWIGDHFTVIRPEEDDEYSTGGYQSSSLSIDGILRLAKVLVYRHGIHGLVLDPWNELDQSRPAYMTETEHVSVVLGKIRQFARLHDIHIWIVAHPAKQSKSPDGRYGVATMYDIAGSAHFFNKTDNGLSVWRNKGGLDETIVDVHSQKARFEESGRLGVYSLRYDPLCRVYVDDVDQGIRRELQAQGKVMPPDAQRVGCRVEH